MFCKLENGQLKIVQFPLRADKDIFTSDEALLREHGFKPVVYENQPELTENEYVTPIYTETETQIIVSWEVHENDEANESDYISALAELGVQEDEEENA